MAAEVGEAANAKNQVGKVAIYCKNRPRILAKINHKKYNKLIKRSRKRGKTNNGLK